MENKLYIYDFETGEVLHIFNTISEAAENLFGKANRTSIILNVLQGKTRGFGLEDKRLYPSFKVPSEATKIISLMKFQEKNNPRLYDSTICFKKKQPNRTKNQVRPKNAEQIVRRLNGIGKGNNKGSKLGLRNDSYFWRKLQEIWKIEPIYLDTQALLKHLHIDPLTMNIDNRNLYPRLRHYINAGVLTKRAVNNRKYEYILTSLLNKESC